MYYWLLFFAFVVTSCSPSADKKHKKQIQGEYIFRLDSEYFFTFPPALHKERPPYPWEERFIGGLPRITKEFFRCKGNPLNSVVVKEVEGKEPIKYFDCQGGLAHSLPLKEGKEFIYPCLLEILNYIQAETGKKVIVTCGHRCPKHNSYSDPSSANWGSKHMIGAEVDFYVEGLEKNPEKIISLIQQYYAATDLQFQRFTSGNLNVSTPPWYNKEIFVKLYLEHEGRDFDNQHPYPYIGIQVRTDRETHSKVTFDPKQAQNYLRH